MPDLAYTLLGAAATGVLYAASKYALATEVLAAYIVFCAVYVAARFVVTWRLGL